MDGAEASKLRDACRFSQRRLSRVEVLFGNASATQQIHPFSSGYSK